jgi:uncharacterized protein (TIGR03000 family)
MNSRVPEWLAFVAAVVAMSSAQAQSTLPNGSQYPYWSSAPSSFSGSTVTVPVPGISPNMISNASQSPPSGASMGNIGGGYTLPYLTSRDIALPKRGGTDNKAHIWLKVPENAEVWVNGVKTRQTGETRYFFSPPLEPGKKYSYQMRVLWKKDGKPVEETQRLLVQAGATIRREITAPPK